MITVKALDSGCASCLKKMEKLVRAAAAELGAEVEIEKVRDREIVKSYNLSAQPGLVIDGKVVSAGRFPPVAEITTWLADALMAAEAPRDAGEE
jgi:hypothetical protein